MVTKMMSLLHLDIIKEYQGAGWLVLLFLAAFVYLCFAEKKKQHRLILIWTTLVVMIIFLFPFTSKFYGGATNGATYYRLLWMLPMGIIIAYAGTKLFLKHRMLGLIVCVPVICFLGKNVYKGQYMYAAENVYHLPQEMMELCDKLHPEFYHVRVCFPAEYVHQVRQYDSSIDLAFSREELVANWSDGNGVYEESQKDVISIEALTEACNKRWTKYYVISKEKPIEGAFEEYGWVYFTESEHYLVYENTNVNTDLENAMLYLQDMTEEDRNEWLKDQNIPVEVYERFQDEKN